MDKLSPGPLTKLRGTPGGPVIRLWPWYDVTTNVTSLQPPPRCGTLTHDNHDVALLRHPQASISGNTGLDWSGEVTWTDGGTAIIRGEKPESTYSGLKDPK